MSPPRHESVLAYHLRTRHAPGRFARALGFLDWDSMPAPYLRYVGASVRPLDRAPSPRPARWDDVIEGRLPSPARPDLDSVSWLFFHALALSARKRAGDASWSLRVDPSSGNLHPTEAYLLTSPLPGLGDTPAVWHYAPALHALELRGELPKVSWACLAAALPPDAIAVALTSIPWREAWKYGERAFRYCQHDLGHVVASVALAAAALGWRARLADAPELGAWLGLADRGPETEIPEGLMILSPEPGPSRIALPRLPAIAWRGTPSPLSREHHEWPVLAEVAEATEGPGPPHVALPPRVPVDGAREIPLGELVRRRRSAVAMDARTAMPLDAFLRTLRRLLPGAPPFDALPWAPAVHLALFVHRVDGLAPGLYLLVRGDEADVRAGVPRAWTAVGDLPFFRLAEGDVRGVAAGVSCDQEIAADGAFAVAMIADLEGGLTRHGGAFWRRLHWEAGAIGQVLYLEAETDGLRGTGIGCFYDEGAARVIGLAPGWASLYHFTVGGPVEDARLLTEDPYG